MSGLFSLHGGSTEGSGNFNSRAAFGMVTLIAMDKAAAFLFKSKKWTFPSALAVMVGVFLTLCDLRKYNSTLADGISDALSPSVSLIKAWLPLFFVPPLVVLPLKMHLLKGMGLQLSAVVAIGSMLSLTSAGLFAQMMNTLFPTAVKNVGEPKAALKSAPLPSLPPLIAPTIATVAFLVASKALPYVAPNAPTAVTAVVQGSYGAAATVAGYIAGTKLPAKVKKIAHPVLICAAVTTGLPAPHNPGQPRRSRPL